jgi:hypothetical protein
MHTIQNQLEENHPKVPNEYKYNINTEYIHYIHNISSFKHEARPESKHSTKPKLPCIK